MFVTVLPTRALFGAKSRYLGLVVALLAMSAVSAQDRWNWAEGSATGEGGASREFYNASAKLRWRNPLGDWRDRDGIAQGNAAFAMATLAAGKAELPVNVELTALVRQWLAGSLANRGLLLQMVNAKGGTVRFASRENSRTEWQPQLRLQFRGSQLQLSAMADTSLDPSTFKSKGKSPVLTVSTGKQNVLLQFDLTELMGRASELELATLQLTAIERLGGSSQIGVFAVDIPAAPTLQGQLGLASRFVLDAKIASDPAVVYATSFDDDDWTEAWQEFRGHYSLVKQDAAFSPLLGQALKVRLEKGDNYGATGSLNFKPLLGAEPEQMYVRYYLRFGSNWRPRNQGGKLPGFAGTYGKGGWGGRPNDGRSGWSARGAFLLQIAEGNPLAGRTPIGSYVYETGKSADFGSQWAWSEGEGAYLETNRWYCVEQYLRLNTVGKDDGELRAWLDGREVLHRRDLRLRLVPELKIEKFWFDIYHGGTAVSPYDQDLYFDNLVIARSYIGPMTLATAGSARSGATGQ